MGCINKVPLSEPVLYVVVCCIVETALTQANRHSDLSHSFPMLHSRYAFTSEETIVMFPCRMTLFVYSYKLHKGQTVLINE